MPIPLDRDPFNIRYSIQEWVRVNFDVPNADYDVNYTNVFFDADARDEETAVRNLWVRVQFLRNLAGRKDFSLVQFDCYSRPGTRATGEDFGRQLALMVKALMDIFMVRSIPIYDFLADPASPALQGDGNVIFAQSSDGKFGTPEDHVLAFWEGDKLHEIVTMRFRTAYDLSPMESFDRGV